MNRKKVISIMMGSIVMSTSVSTGVWADDTYKEIEKAALQQKIKGLAGIYENSIKYQEDAFAGTEAKLALNLSDTGKVLIGTLAGMDLSWANNAEIDMQISMQDGLMGESADINLNGQKICTLEEYVDMESMECYIKIPELSEKFLKLDVQEMDEEEGDSDFSNMEMSYEMIKTISDMQEYLSDATMVEELLNTYTSILVDSARAGESVSETISVGEISTECNTYEGILSEKEGIVALKEILTTARNDENIKKILMKWGETEESPEEFYAAYQMAIDAIVPELEEEIEVNDDDSYFYSKLWTDEDGNVVGRELGLHHEEGIVDPLVTYKLLKDQEAFSMELEGMFEDQGIKLTGNGQIQDGILDGEYVLTVNSEDVVKIQVSDYEIESMETGKLNSSYEISMLPGMMDPEVYSAFGNYSLSADIKSGEIDGEILLNLLSQGVSLADLNITSSLGEGVEIPELDSIEAYSMNDSEEYEMYLSEISTETIMDNLKAAGVPEELLGAF